MKYRAGASRTLLLFNFYFRGKIRELSRVKVKESVIALKSYLRRRRRPMTTIPTRLARAATVSTTSIHQRKRVLDLYREWIRGVRSQPPSAVFIPKFLNTVLLSPPQRAPIGT